MASPVVSALQHRTKLEKEMSRLENRIAVVTGANSGIALATAKIFLEEGAARVYGTGRRKVELDAAVASFGDRAVPVQSDVMKPEDLERLPP
jgi:NADP-dependent 3-hydroxy acid dehydrogenase YdfG